MLLRSCFSSVCSHLPVREACRGSNVILGMALAGAVVAGLAMLLLRLSETL